MRPNAYRTGRPRPTAYDGFSAHFTDGLTGSGLVSKTESVGVVSTVGGHPEGVISCAITAAAECGASICSTNLPNDAGADGAYPSLCFETQLPIFLARVQFNTLPTGGQALATIGLCSGYVNGGGHQEVASLSQAAFYIDNYGEPTWGGVAGNWTCINSGNSDLAPNGLNTGIAAVQGTVYVLGIDLSKPSRPVWTINGTRFSSNTVATRQPNSRGLTPYAGVATNLNGSNGTVDLWVDSIEMKWRRNALR